MSTFGWKGDIQKWTKPYEALASEAGASDYVYSRFSPIGDLQGGGIDVALAVNSGRLDQLASNLIHLGDSRTC